MHISTSHIIKKIILIKFDISLRLDGRFKTISIKLVVIGDQSIWNKEGYI